MADKSIEFYDNKSRTTVSLKAVDLGDGTHALKTSGGGGGAAYKTYVALVTQTGTAAPAATVLENTLAGAPAWSRVTQGQYRLTLAGAFGAAKTAVFITGVNQSDGAAPVNFHTWGGEGNFITLTVLDSTQMGAALDEWSASVEVRVYP